MAHGADIDAKDNLGQTALHKWAGGWLSPDQERVEALLAHGANANAVDKSANTPLDLAAAQVEKRFEEMMKNPGGFFVSGGKERSDKYKAIRDLLVSHGGTKR